MHLGKKQVEHNKGWELLFGNTISLIWMKSERTRRRIFADVVENNFMSSLHRYITRHRGARTSMDAGTATYSGKLDRISKHLHPMIVYAKQSKLLHNIHHPVANEWASDLMDRRKWRNLLDWSLSWSFPLLAMTACKHEESSDPEALHWYIGQASSCSSFALSTDQSFERTSRWVAHNLCPGDILNNLTFLMHLHKLATSKVSNFSSHWLKWYSRIICVVSCICIKALNKATYGYQLFT